MSTYYVTQERAMAPGISGEWPQVIPAPHTKHGRLVKLTYVECVAIESLLDPKPEQSAVLVIGRDSIDRLVERMTHQSCDFTVRPQPDQRWKVTVRMQDYRFLNQALIDTKAEWEETT